jgi:hypothetical protein
VEGFEAVEVDMPGLVDVRTETEVCSVEAENGIPIEVKKEHLFHAQIKSTSVPELKCQP